MAKLVEVGRENVELLANLSESEKRLKETNEELTLLRTEVIP